jgi:hypothetical protein
MRVLHHFDVRAVPSARVTRLSCLQLGDVRKFPLLGL